jgi:hypothetical protein
MKIVKNQEVKVKFNKSSSHAFHHILPLLLDVELQYSEMSGKTQELLVTREEC